MAKKSVLDQSAIKSLPPGAWAWDDGIGYRRHASDEGGNWYIKYRAPLPGHFSKGHFSPHKTGERAIAELPQSFAGRRCLDGT